MSLCCIRVHRSIQIGFMKKSRKISPRHRASIATEWMVFQIAWTLQHMTHNDILQNCADCGMQNKRNVHCTSIICRLRTFLTINRNALFKEIKVKGVKFAYFWLIKLQNLEKPDHLLVKRIGNHGISVAYKMYPRIVPSYLLDITDVVISGKLLIKMHEFDILRSIFTETSSCAVRGTLWTMNCLDCIKIYRDLCFHNQQRDENVHQEFRPQYAKTLRKYLQLSVLKRLTVIRLLKLAIRMMILGYFLTDKVLLEVKKHINLDF